MCRRAFFASLVLVFPAITFACGPVFDSKQLLSLVFFGASLLFLLVVFIVKRRSMRVPAWRIVLETFAVVLVSIFFFSIVFMSQLTFPRCGGGEASIKASLAGLRAVATEYASKTGSYAGFCEQNPEVQYYRNYINEMNKPDAQRFACFSDKSQYAISANLHGVFDERERVYFCVDSTGFIGDANASATASLCQRSID